MFWKIFGSEERVAKALRAQTDVQELSPESLNMDDPKNNRPISWSELAYSEFASANDKTGLKLMTETSTSYDDEKKTA